jgi:hypothetical protein
MLSEKDKLDALTRLGIDLNQIQDLASKGDLLGVLQIINAKDESRQLISFTATHEKIMMHFASIAAVALARAQMTRAILLRMMKMAEMRDPKETGAHVNRVAGYAVEIYEKWAHRHNVLQADIDKKRDVLRSIQKRYRD